MLYFKDEYDTSESIVNMWTSRNAMRENAWDDKYFVLSMFCIRNGMTAVGNVCLQLREGQPCNPSLSMEGGKNIDN